MSVTHNIKVTKKHAEQVTSMGSRECTQQISVGGLHFQKTNYIFVAMDLKLFKAIGFSTVIVEQWKKCKANKKQCCMRCYAISVIA